jgi:flagellar hook-associated protein 1 FlgK
MPGAFHGINTATRAMRSFQRALETAGHNLANVNTPGFSRQVVDLASADPASLYSVGRQALGAGVTISSINRIRDLFLEARMQGASSDLSKFTSQSATLKQIEHIFGEPSDSGIANALNRMFDAWSGLASNPNGSGARIEVRNAGELLTHRVRSAFSQLTELKAQLEGQVTAQISRISEIGTELAKLNAQIRFDVVSGGTPSDLLDQRDRLIGELSEFTPVRTATFSDGTMAVYLSQFTLVQGETSHVYPSQFNAGTYSITDGVNTYDVRSGSLFGLMHGLNAIQSQQAQLDLLSNTLKTQFNSLHMTGVNLNGTTGIRFFHDASPQTGAIDFRLSNDVLADIKNIASGTSGDAGDGGLALSLSNLRSAALGALGTKTFQSYYGDAVAALAQEAARATNNRETQAGIVQQIEAQRSAISGVSIDEEMASMLRFQRSYQAAARVLSVLDQVTEDLVNIIR